ncbi:mitochondrial distribution and morphology proteins-domain-containing protein [Cristinia sonorae]|uniref:Mitochondrial distribution and morphology proteins-domain-containing protein n=1 Tax=Cristinia sonorae TaxID=1940300 RepID=A0A8K0UYG4_9AGAR|nr:mitochondrial distribution and morphology proteins-domain-containing protein [Cristinia sonorae]
MANVLRNVVSRGRSPLSSLHRSRFASDAAALDRYTTIWSFFRVQTRNVHVVSPVPPPAYKRSIALRLLGEHRTTRSFGLTASLRQDDPNRSPKPIKDQQEERPPDPPPAQPEHDPSRIENYPRLFRRLALSLPHLHRPTRDDFLNAATGFWQRLRIRFKWLTIRSFRKYNADDISAFVTWFFMSQTLWLFVGTTTFFSVIFATVNSLQLQAYVARAISDYLTSETGITIIFESAIVPKWKDSRISIKNVFITRRPTSARLRQKSDAGHLAAAGYDVSNHPSYHSFEEDEEDSHLDMSDEDTNYTMFDLNVDTIEVTLSLARWFNGKGLVEDAVIKGVRGVVDRRSVHWDPEHPLDPALYRHKAQPGDFELESLQLEDVLVTVYQPGHFRPYTASIFRADMRCFRKQWCFYDFLSAENVVGQFDNCLFSLHKPQSIGRTTEQELKDGQWARMARFRIDGVNIDHLQATTTQEGPISWITSGKLDAVLDIKFPRDPEDDLPLNAFLEEIADAITTAATSAVADRIPGQRELAKPPLSAPSDREVRGEDDKAKVVVDIDLRFRDLKAAVPIFTHDLSYTNNALIRPIVAFMNANRTLVPIHCRVVRDLSDFDGAWTMWETGLMDVIADKVYEAMAFHVTQANINRRIKAVSTWSLHMTTSAIISAMRSIVDPMAMHLRDIYRDGFPVESGAVFAVVGA